MRIYSFIKSANTQSALQQPIVKENNYPFAITEIVVPQAIQLFKLYTPLDNHFKSALKRSFDIIFSSVLIILLLSWVVPLIALLIKIDSKGPVFFLQKRHKKHRKLFTCIKFRTMVVNKDADCLPACESDCRITRLGRFLRHHHIDELPQLLNVLCGDMSVVGPRPYMISDDKRYGAATEHYHFRYNVKPGITGLAQSLGHHGCLTSGGKMEERLQLDLQYIKAWSFKMDVQILLHTLYMLTGLKNFIG